MPRITKCCQEPKRVTKGSQVLPRVAKASMGFQGLSRLDKGCLESPNSIKDDNSPQGLPRVAETNYLTALQ